MVNQIDASVVRWFAELDAPAWLDSFMIFWTNQIQPLYVVAAVILLFFKPTRKAGIIALTAICLSALSVEFGWKRLFERVRPYDEFDFIHILVNPEKSFSFPSGHTSLAFSAAFAMCRQRSAQIKAALLFCAALTAFSRLYLCVHYLTDVLAGAANGVACALLAAFIVSFFEKRNPVFRQK